MSRRSPSILTLLLAASCACGTNSSAAQAVNSNQNAQPTAEGAQLSPAASGRDSAEAGKENDVPPEFREVDFENFSYPISWKRQVIRLTDGEYEYYKDEKLEGSGWFRFGAVNYADLTGDGKKEAVVRVFWVSCGASCDGGSNLFYVYSSRRDKPALFWRIETGSLGYGCGLKSLAVKGRTITLELFNKCRFKGATPEREEIEGELGKFSALVYTRFDFESDGRKVTLKRSEQLPYPQFDTKNYPSEISIGDG